MCSAHRSVEKTADNLRGAGKPTLYDNSWVGPDQDPPARLIDIMPPEHNGGITGKWGRSISFTDKLLQSTRHDLPQNTVPQD